MATIILSPLQKFEMTELMKYTYMKPPRKVVFGHFYG